MRPARSASKLGATSRSSSHSRSSQATEGGPSGPDRRSSSSRYLFAWKTGGLDAAGLAVRLAPSTMSIGGLIKHLACVEDTHFARLLLDAPPPAPWSGVDWDLDPDWDWTSAADDRPEHLAAQWEESVARSRALVGAALADGGLDHPGNYRTRSGEHPSLRRILIDLIEEYARHLGHADLLREAVDGLVGEDPEG